MEIKESTKQDWDSFLGSSPQGTIYCSTFFLDNLELDYDLLLAIEKDVPQLGVIILKDKDKAVSGVNYFMQYNGFLMKKDALNMPSHRFNQWFLEVSAFMIEALSKKYDKIFLSMHPSWCDMRPFQWFNYHTPERGIFKLTPRYTGYVHLGRFKDFNDYYMTVRNVRRYEYRQALKKKLVAEESDDIEELIRLDILTYDRTKSPLSELSKDVTRRIASSALRNKYGRLLVCKDVDQNILSANLFLFDNNCAYYHMAANAPQYRHTFSGTFLIFEQIKYFFVKNTPLIDFNGLNSPNRGDYKMSFNLSLACHFWAEWSGVVA